MRKLWNFIILTWTITILPLCVCYHCADKEKPHRKASDCPAGKSHSCLGLIEDLSSLTCRCTEDATCKEACGIPFDASWSSKEGSWSFAIEESPEIPHSSISDYVRCAKVPGGVKAPHNLEYTMCMCNDHYYTYGYKLTDAYKDNFAKEFMTLIWKKRGKPELKFLGSARYVENLPDLKYPNNAYKDCREVSRGEEFQPKDYLGRDWCSLEFCLKNNPFAKGRMNPTLRVFKCSETCSCFLEPEADV